jgi:hypothetical protein
MIPGRGNDASISLLQGIQTESEAPQSPIQQVLGALYSGIRRQGREA